MRPGREAVEISEPTATAAKTQTGPRRNASPDRVADKRGDAVRAKKKKKRDAHRVALRRSHTKG
jgi:hypothetical protein